MSSYAHFELEIPDGLLPAQLGLVLVGRPVLGHAAVTLVSLARRGMLRAEETDGTWRIGRPTPHHKSQAPARFERALLDGLPAESAPLSELPDAFAPALRHFAHDLVKDAVHRGWFKHTHHDQRTSRGEELAARIRSLRAALRHEHESPYVGTVDFTHDEWRGMGLSGAAILSMNL